MYSFNVRFVSDSLLIEIVIVTAEELVLGGVKSGIKSDSRKVSER